MDYRYYDQIYYNNTRPVKNQQDQDNQINQDQDNQEQALQNINPRYAYLFMIIMCIITLISLYLLYIRYTLLNKSINTKQYMSSLALASPELGLFTKFILSFL